MSATRFSLAALCLVVATTIPASRASAQEQRLSTAWIGIAALFPTGDLADVYDVGFGLTGESRWVVSPRFDSLLEGAWYNYSSSDVTLDGETLKFDSFNAYTFTVGGLYAFGRIKVGAKGGYFFGDLHEWDVIPTAELSFRRLAVGAEYKAAGSANWGSAFVKYRW